MAKKTAPTAPTTQPTPPVETLAPMPIPTGPLTKLSGSVPKITIWRLPTPIVSAQIKGSRHVQIQLVDGYVSDRISFHIPKIDRLALEIAKEKIPATLKSFRPDNDHSTPEYRPLTIAPGMYGPESVALRFGGDHGPIIAHAVIDPTVTFKVESSFAAVHGDDGDGDGDGDGYDDDGDENEDSDGDDD